MPVDHAQERAEAIASSAASQMSTPAPHSLAMTTPHRASIEAMEMSMSPAMMTGATPSARHARTALLNAIV